jgi:hypothetical protein
MASFKERLLHLADIYVSLKEKSLIRQEHHQHRELALKKARALAKHEREAALKKNIVQLEHDISLLQTQHKTELTMFKNRCAQDIQDYRQFLKALDELKKVIQTSYAHLPMAVAFTIHHHAKYLLNQMWEAKTDEQKRQFEYRLIQFMATAHEEARLFGAMSNADALPKNTLSLIHSLPHS